MWISEWSERLVFCVTTDLYLFQESWWQTLLGVTFHSVARVSLPTFRRTEFQYWLEIDRLISQDLSLRYIFKLLGIFKIPAYNCICKSVEDLLTCTAILAIYAFLGSRSYSLFVGKKFLGCSLPLAMDGK